MNLRTEPPVRKHRMQRLSNIFMEQNEIGLKALNANTSLEELEHLFGEQHMATTYDTPLRKDAFDLPDDEKIKIISRHFKEIMLTLGLDLQDDSLKGTPKRIGKMFVKEIFGGLNPGNKPVITLFDNKYQYNRMLVEKNITVYSNCEHHFVPIIGKAHIGYISSGKVIGISKLNRIVQYYSQRPQVQERLTIQIAKELKTVLQTDDVAVLIAAAHLCVSSRGVKDITSSTITAEYSGEFLRDARRDEFLKYLN